MVRRVVAADWSLTQAAEAAGVSERTASKWVARYRREGEVGLADRSSAPKALANRTDESRIETIAALRRLRMTGAEIAECLEMALSTVSGVLARIGLGKLSRLEPPEPANRYERARPGELIHIDVKKLGAIKGGLGHRAHGSRRHSPRGGGWEFVHVFRRRRHPPGLRRGARRREGEHRGWLPAPRHGLLPRPWGQGRKGDDRQRRCLSLERARDRLPGTRAATHPHPSLPPAHQRQGRALHPHDARWLGLRSALRQLSRTQGSPRRLAGLLQSPPKTRLPRPPAADRAAQRAPDEQRVAFEPLPVDEAVPERYGDLLAFARSAGRSAKATDLLILATAATSERVLYTLDVSQARLGRAAGVPVEGI